MKKLEYSPSSSDGSRSVSYRSRINPVLFPYRPSFFLLSSFFRCSIILASRSGKNTERIRKRYGNHAGLIRKQQEEQRRNNGGTREEEGRKEGQEKANGQSVHWHSSTWLAIVLRRKPFTEMAETEQNKLFRLVPLTRFQMEAQPFVLYALTSPQAYLHGIYLFAQKSLQYTAAQMRIVKHWTTIIINRAKAKNVR